jgi:hypothetical protein
MSTDYIAEVYYGILISKEDTEILTKDPLFGVHKFNPDTGEKVEEFTRQEVNIHEIAEELDLSCTEIHGSIEDYYVIGHVSNRVNCKRPNAILLGRLLHEVKSDTKLKLNKFKKQTGIPQDICSKWGDPEEFLVGYYW